jgi:matrix metalloproteinase-14 (membrane-inserted)
MNNNTWKGVWAAGIDAAYNMGNGKVYFFKGTEYIRYDLKEKNSDEGYPVEISRGWQGVSKADAIADWENGKIYIFKNNR